MRNIFSAIIIVITMSFANLAMATPIAVKNYEVSFYSPSLEKPKVATLAVKNSDGNVDFSFEVNIGAITTPSSEDEFIDQFIVNWLSPNEDAEYEFAPQSLHITGDRKSVV